MAITPLRPQSTLPVATTPAPTRASLAREAAQKAFFQAALGGEQIAAARQPTPIEPAAPASRFSPQPSQAAPPELPSRILRPGSFIDIKV